MVNSLAGYVGQARTAHSRSLRLRLSERRRKSNIRKVVIQSKAGKPTWIGIVQLFMHSRHASRDSIRIFVEYSIHCDYRALAYVYPRMVEHCDEIPREVSREICRRYVRDAVQGNGDVCGYGGSKILGQPLVSETYETRETHLFQQIRRKHEHIRVGREGLCGPKIANRLEMRAR